MKNVVATIGLTLATSLALGCSGGADASGDPAGSDDSALRTSSACPAEIEVHLTKPRIASDRRLLEIYESDWRKSGGGGNVAQYAKDQLDSVQPFLTVARADEEVTLRGTSAGACTYRTVDAATGAANGYHVWIRPSSLALRIEQGLDLPDSVVFYDVPLKSVSATKIKIDDTKQTRVSAENTSRGHDGSDGWSYYIGNVDATVTIGH